MKLEAVKIDFPAEEGCNIILGHSHFIKTVEDIYEAIVTAVPGIKFGLAFCEASQDCLIRKDGTDGQLIDIAVENMKKIAAGHSFLIVLGNVFPINVLPNLKQCMEVVSIYCATANPVEVIIAETEQGRGILGVVDGFTPKGVESQEDIRKRKELLREIGYKQS
jgi:hypothetical protein